MAEETTSQNTPNEGPQDGQPSGTSERPVAQTPSQEAAKPVVNWQEQPEYKEHQRRLAQREREREQRHQREMAELRAHLDAVLTRDMPESERWQHELQKAQRALQEKDAQLQAYQAEQARIAALSEISSETGAPIHVLMEADNPDDAWRKGFRWAKENLTKAQQQQVAQEAEERRANTVDLGRGASRSTKSDLRAEYEEALENNDGAALYALRVRARREGIEL